MSRSIFLALAFVTILSSAARAAPADDVKAAITKVADSPSYAWHATSNVRTWPVKKAYPPGIMVPQNISMPLDLALTIDGKAKKDGTFAFTITGDHGPFDVVIMNGKIAIKVGDTWKTADDMLNARPKSSQEIAALMAARYARDFQSPTDAALDSLKGAHNFQKNGDSWTADLPTTADPMGGKIMASAQYWMVDGLLGKFQVHRASDGFESTETTEISQVGTASFEIPDAAKAKLQAPPR